MIEEKLNHSPEGMKQIIVEHLPYEIWMMRHAFNRLLNAFLYQAEGNALIESFCVHARNLIDFFRGNGKIPDGEAFAVHFTTTEYKSFPNGDPDSKIYGKLNAQIAHNTYNRTANANAKVGIADRFHLMKMIDEEVENFAGRLKEPYKSCWPIGLVKAKVQIPINPYLGATNAIATTSSGNTMMGFGATGPAKE